MLSTINNAEWSHGVTINIYSLIGRSRNKINLDADNCIIYFPDV